jgi:hypothetical protein
MNFLDFVVETYEDPIPKKLRGHVSKEYLEEQEIAKSPQLITNNGIRHRGRPTNLRSFYHSNHPKHQNMLRVIRTSGHNTLPAVVGAFFPRKNDSRTRDFYCASMLSLLKPWRNIECLKHTAETWEEAYQQFMKDSSKRCKNVVAGIDYYYDCKNLAEKRYEVCQSALSSSNESVPGREAPSLDECEEMDDSNVCCIL